jgi:hypothetical protein
MRTLNLQDPNPSPGEFHDNPGSGHTNKFLIYGNTSPSAYLTLTVKYQRQKFDVVKSPFKRGKVIKAVLTAMPVRIFHSDKIGE